MMLTLLKLPPSLNRTVSFSVTPIWPKSSVRRAIGVIGYVFPRQDHLVVGGTIERQYADEKPDPLMRALLIRIAKAVFDGAMPVPTWLSGNSRAIDPMMLTD